MTDNRIKLEELHCPLCKDGIHNNDICPLCLGYGVLFRIAQASMYNLGSEVYIENYSKAC